MSYHTTINGTRWTFHDLKTLLAKASPARSGDALAGVAAQSAIERVAAQTQRERGVTRWWYSLDFNERCPHVGYLLEFLAKVREQAAEGF